MPFIKGVRIPGQGGHRKHAGRPTREYRALNKLVGDEIREYIERRVKPIADNYIALATGGKVGKKVRALDPATCRHAVERFVGPAPRRLILDANETIETLFEKIASEQEEEGKDGKK